MNKKLLGVLLLLVTLSKSIIAQDKQAEMADVLRENGKIYNVVAVVLVILIGFLVYLFITERKLKDLENKLNK
ncbi:MAG: CcmD family protein [Opitutaceae bacterium]|nr:CcmD family protein [Cytophagales bacterium]